MAAHLKVLCHFAAIMMHDSTDRHTTKPHRNGIEGRHKVPKHALRV